MRGEHFHAYLLTAPGITLRGGVTGHITSRIPPTSEHFTNRRVPWLLSRPLSTFS